jgi:hypothetical protein
MFKSRSSLALLVGAVALSRWAFRSHFLYDLDSVNFALAMGRFDPRVHQPHPPGYFLYICLGRLLQTVFHDANLALVILSILASCGAVVVIYQIAMEWFGPRPALFAGTLFLFSPLAWFHGTVALTYIVEAFFSGLIGFFCWRIYNGSQGFILPAALSLGVSGGIRPSSLVFLSLLFLFSLRKVPWKGRCLGVAALIMTVVAWFVPMLNASGGFEAYFGALLSLWRMVPSKGTIFNSSPANSIARAFTILFIYLLCFGAASFAPLGVVVAKRPVEREKKSFTLVWVLPALCFFTFGYLKFVNSGYLLLLSVPASIWLGFWLSEWYDASSWRRSLKMAVLGACVVVNVLVFLESPLYCSYRSVRRFEAQLESLITAVPQVASASDTVILSVDSHFDGFRHAGYYLPGYLTVEYPEAHLKEGPRIFSMHERDTRFLTGLPGAPYTRFVLFPLPAEDSYREYLQTVTARLPNGDLHTVSAGGHEFTTGPISDFPLLFPEAVRAP